MRMYELKDKEKENYQKDISKTIQNKPKNWHILKNYPAEKKSETDKDDIINERIFSVFSIIHDNDNDNLKFKTYLCEILDNKHDNHIFNTYFYIIKTIFFYLRNIYIPFFVLLALNTNSSFDVDELYSEKLGISKGKKLYGGDMAKIIDVFIHIFNFPDELICENTQHKNSEIIKLILDGQLIHLDIIVGSITNPPEYDPSNTPLPWAIYCKNAKFLELFNLINAPGNAYNPVNTDNTDTIHPSSKNSANASRKYRLNQSTSSQTRSRRSKSPVSQIEEGLFSPVEGIVDFITDFSSDKTHTKKRRGKNRRKSRGKGRGKGRKTSGLGWRVATHG